MRFLLRLAIATVISMLAFIVMLIGISLLDPAANAAERLALFDGSYTVTGAVDGPWYGGKVPDDFGNPGDYIGKVVTIANGRIDGPGLLACAEAGATVDDMPFAGMFEGGLSTIPGDATAAADESLAKPAATRLGYAAEPVATLFSACNEIQLHRRDDRSLQFALDNRIYTLERKP